MLADAGYPNGFTLELPYYAISQCEDEAAMVASMWSKIGVKTILQPLDNANYNRIRVARGYKNVLMQYAAGPSSVWVIPQNMTPLSRGGNGSLWYDSHASDLWSQINGTTDANKQNALIKELCLYTIDQVPRVGLPTGYQTTCAWKWVKNYYGEIDSGFTNYTPMLASLWIDSDLKKKLR